MLSNSRLCPFPPGHTSSHRAGKTASARSLLVRISTCLQMPLYKGHWQWSPGSREVASFVLALALGERSVLLLCEKWRQLRMTSGFPSDLFQSKISCSLYVLPFLKIPSCFTYYENIGSSHKSCRRLNQGLQKPVSGTLGHCNRPPKASNKN